MNKLDYVALIVFVFSVLQIIVNAGAISSPSMLLRVTWPQLGIILTIFIGYVIYWRGGFGS